MKTPPSPKAKPTSAARLLDVHPKLIGPQVPRYRRVTRPDLFSRAELATTEPDRWGGDAEWIMDEVRAAGGTVRGDDVLLPAGLYSWLEFETPRQTERRRSAGAATDDPFASPLFASVAPSTSRCRKAVPHA